MRKRIDAKRGYWDRDTLLSIARESEKVLRGYMEKQKLRVILGQLIALSNLFKAMETEGFEWEKQSEYVNLLDEMIADLERAIDD